MQEIWKDIPNYEGIYQVSNLGNVRDIITDRHRKPKNLTLNHRSGYYSVMLCKDKTQKNVLVHRLVAQSFIPNPQNKPQVNHIDGNKQNNCVDNLEWCTAKENLQHASKMGLLQKEKQIRKRTVYQFSLSGTFIKEWESYFDAAKSLNVRPVNIYRCLSGEHNSSCGYIWSWEQNLSQTQIKHVQKHLRIIKSPRRKPRTTLKPILQYDLDGKLVACYLNIKIASISTGFSYSMIYNSCKGVSKQSQGFIWRFAVPQDI